MKCIYWPPEVPYARSCKNDDGEEMFMKWEFKKYDHLQDAVKRFFEILNIKEESSFGVKFHPNRMNLKNGTIDSCRVYNSAELKSILDQMEVMSGYRQD